MRSRPSDSREPGNGVIELQHAVDELTEAGVFRSPRRRGTGRRGWAAAGQVGRLPWDLFATQCGEHAGHGVAGMELHGGAQSSPQLLDRVLRQCGVVDLEMRSIREALENRHHPIVDQRATELEVHVEHGGREGGLRLRVAGLLGQPAARVVLEGVIT